MPAKKRTRPKVEDRQKRVIPGSLKAIKPDITHEFASQTVVQDGARKLLRLIPLSTFQVQTIYCNNTFAVPATAAANARLLNPISEGVGLENRLANKVMMRTLVLRVNFQLPLNVLVYAQPYVVNAVVLYDKQCNGTLPTFSDIFDINDPLCSQNRDNFDRFEVLFRKSTTLMMDKFTFTSAGTFVAGGASPASFKYFEWKIPINRPTEFLQGAASGSYTSIRMGSLHLIMWNSQLPDEALNYRAFTSHQLSFTDLV